MRGYIIGFGLTDRIEIVYAKSVYEAIDKFCSFDEPYLISEVEDLENSYSLDRKVA